MSLSGGLLITLGLIALGAIFGGMDGNWSDPRYVLENDNVHVLRSEELLVSRAEIGSAWVFDTDEEHRASFDGLTDYFFVRRFTRGSDFVSIDELPRWLRGEPIRFHGPRRVFMAPSGQRDLYGESTSFAFGLPFRCVTFRRVWGDSTVSLVTGIEFDPPALVYKLADPPEMFVLPYGVMLLPTMVNAIVWSIPAFVLLTGLASLRRWNRTRRGRCGVCAYDLRGDLTSGCPECGWRRAP